MTGAAEVGGSAEEVEPEGGAEADGRDGHQPAEHRLEPAGRAVDALEHLGTLFIGGRGGPAATRMVLALVATTSAAAVAKISSATRRLSQPAMPSMASSDQPTSRPADQLVVQALGGVLSFVDQRLQNLLEQMTGADGADHLPELASQARGIGFE